jgi:AAA15 family ATPase/GTPase
MKILLLSFLLLLSHLVHSFDQLEGFHHDKNLKAQIQCFAQRGLFNQRSHFFVTLNAYSQDNSRNLDYELEIRIQSSRDSLFRAPAEIVNSSSERINSEYYLAYFPEIGEVTLFLNFAKKEGLLTGPLLKDSPESMRLRNCITTVF